jgi:hypothetical protein
MVQAGRWSPLCYLYVPSPAIAAGACMVRLAGGPHRAKHIIGLSPAIAAGICMVQAGRWWPHRAKHIIGLSPAIAAGACMV